MDICGGSIAVVHTGCREVTALFEGQLIPNAPDDLIAGLGANDQKLYIVPSQNLVIIRMGDAANGMQLGSIWF